MTAIGTAWADGAWIYESWEVGAWSDVTASTTKVKVMMSLNKNEYGTSLYTDMKEDISAGTAFSFIIQPKVGDSKEMVGTIGTVDITVDDQDYTANQYLTYELLDGDLDQSGLWRIKGEATMTATKVIYGDFAHITVLD